MTAKEKKQRVFVALSGGVDSAVTAALLQKQGFNVIGVFIKIWQPEFVECTWKEDRLDAIRVAVVLGIPFREIDLSNAYKEQVVGAMLADYASGITPNPDVLCNRFIKFGALWEWAQKEGADFIATGHHARIRKNGDGAYSLIRGVDEGKDQSYFLWQLTQNDLEHTLMPVGELQKKAVRALAEKYNLPVAGKPDSQGLCFVGDINMQDFLKKLIMVKPGKVITADGDEIGRHSGAELYTIGQRHGFEVYNKGVTSEPRYVSKVDVQKNTLTVSKKKEDITAKKAVLSSVNWVREGAKKEDDFEGTCQLRYRQPPQMCRFEENGKEGSVHFKETQIVVPGQSLVLYRKDECIAGGIIVGV